MHRYGQKRDVTVVNFLAKDNEAQRLTLEILTQKLDLFGDVLDMSDSVLYEARSKRSEELTTALGPDFELQLNRIWETRPFDRRGRGGVAPSAGIHGEPAPGRMRTRVVARLYANDNFPLPVVVQLRHRQ